MLLIFIGFAGGVLSGMLGVGGGIIFIPVLQYLGEKIAIPNAFLGKVALANSMCLVFISGIVASIKQYIKKEIQVLPILYISISGIIFSTLISISIQQGDWYNKRMFQWIFLVFLLWSAVYFLFKNQWFVKNEMKNTALQNPISLYFLIGSIAGSTVALSGLGGGIVMVPLFVWLLNLSMQSAATLSLSIIPILTLFPFVTYMLASPITKTRHTIGYIELDWIIPIAMGIFIGTPMGMYFAKKIQQNHLRIIFASLTVFIITKTVWELLNEK